MSGIYVFALCQPLSFFLHLPESSGFVALPVALEGFPGHRLAPKCLRILSVVQVVAHDWQSENVALTRLRRRAKCGTVLARLKCQDQAVRREKVVER